MHYASGTYKRLVLLEEEEKKKLTIQDWNYTYSRIASQPVRCVESVASLNDNIEACNSLFLEVEFKKMWKRKDGNYMTSHT